MDTYEKLVRYMDEQISKAVLGETMSTTASSAGLGSGQANVHNDVRKELAEDDSDELCETLNATLVAWTVAYNLPGANLPTISREFEEPEDLAQRATRDKTVKELGYEPTEQYILKTYGDGWVRSQAQAPGGGMFASLLPGAEQTASFSEVSNMRKAKRDNQDLLENVADQLAGQWQQTMKRRVEDLQSMLDETGDLQQFRERLADLLDSDPSPALVDSITRANFSAHVLGRGPADADFSEQPQGFFKSLFKRWFGG